MKVWTHEDTHFVSQVASVGFSRRHCVGVGGWAIQNTTVTESNRPPGGIPAPGVSRQPGARDARPNGNTRAICGEALPQGVSTAWVRPNAMKLHPAIWPVFATRPTKLGNEINVQSTYSQRTVNIQSTYSQHTVNINSFCLFSFAKPMNSNKWVAKSFLLI